MNEIHSLRQLGDIDLTVSDEDEDIRGRTVRDQDGTVIGKVHDLLVDEGGRQVRMMLVVSGGFLGVGEETVYIPIEAITMFTDVDVWIDQTHEHVVRVPHYDPHLVPSQKYLGGMAY